MGCIREDGPNRVYIYLGIHSVKCSPHERETHGRIYMWKMYSRLAGRRREPERARNYTACIYTCICCMYIERKTGAAARARATEVPGVPVCLIRARALQLRYTRRLVLARRDNMCAYTRVCAARRKRDRERALSQILSALFNTLTHFPPSCPSRPACAYMQRNAFLQVSIVIYVESDQLYVRADFSWAKVFRESKIQGGKTWTALLLKCR